MSPLKEYIGVTAAPLPPRTYVGIIVVAVAVVAESTGIVTPAVFTVILFDAPAAKPIEFVVVRYIPISGSALNEYAGAAAVPTELVRTRVGVKFVADKFVTASVGMVTPVVFTVIRFTPAALNRKSLFV